MVFVTRMLIRRALPRTAEVLAATACLALSSLVLGCGAGSFGATPQPETPTSADTGSATGVSFTVRSLAGSRAIAGASVQLYAAGTSGNGSLATRLLAKETLTDTNGIALIASSYTCPEPTSLLYLVSQGGTIGQQQNPNINNVLMAALGPCSQIASASKFLIDEVTTVAAAYSLAQFYGTGATLGSIGASSTNLTGAANAFAMANSLADPATGTSPGSTLPKNAASPAARVNTVANILNSCVMTAETCDVLYRAIAPPGITLTNTLDAAFQLARNPAASVAELFALSQTHAFAPSLATAPTDWTMFVTYSGGGLNSPAALAVDSTGSVWVANYFKVASRFSPLGAPIFTNGVSGPSLNNSYGLAVDLKDNAWITNEGPYQSQGIGSVTQLTATGIALSGDNGYQSGGLDFPIAVAIDPNGTTWVVDNGNSHITLLNPSGTPLSGLDGFTSSTLAFPSTVAIDAEHFGWIGNQNDVTVTKVAPDGSSFLSVDCCSGASGIAIDQNNKIWVANLNGDNASLIASSGAVLSKGGFNGLGSMRSPQGIAIDGAGSVWFANYLAPYLTELSGTSSVLPGTSLSPTAGLGADAGLLQAFALAIDASGNIWVSNQGSSTLTKYIGLAAPVKTPLSGLPKQP